MVIFLWLLILQGGRSLSTLGSRNRFPPKSYDTLHYLCPGATCPISNPKPAGTEFLFGRGLVPPPGDPTAQWSAWSLGLSVSLCEPELQYSAALWSHVPVLNFKRFWSALDLQSVDATGEKCFSFPPSVGFLSIFPESGWFGLSAPWSLTFTFACWDTEIPANGRVITHSSGDTHVSSCHRFGNSGNCEREVVKYTASDWEHGVLELNSLKTTNY